MRAPTALVCVALCLSSVPARADATLPLSRAEIPLWELGLGGQRVLELRGTLDSTLDGSRYDALHALDRAGRASAEPSLLRLPPGTRVLESDPAAHRYVVELPREAPPLLRLDTSALARAHWVTRAQARASLGGALLASAPGAPDNATRQLAPHAPTLAGATADSPLALGALAIALLLALWARVRRRPDLHLPARARRALGRLRREAARQGPVFVELAEEAERLWRDEGLTALRQLQAAAREHRALRHARATLELRRSEALAALRAVVETLEAAVAQLTDHRVRELDDDRLAADTGALRSQLALALQADHEARSL